MSWCDLRRRTCETQIVWHWNPRIIPWPVVDIVRPRVKELVVGNPLKTKAIAEAKIKTDKIDAEVLAQLLRCEYLPDFWQPDAMTKM